MKLFKTLFNLAKLPVVIVADSVTAIPDSAMLMPTFERTRKVCDKIDDALTEKP
jgi:hypothetical protein